jgi:hypothetical protein
MVNDRIAYWYDTALCYKEVNDLTMAIELCRQLCSEIEATPLEDLIPIGILKSARSLLWYRAGVLMGHSSTFPGIAKDFLKDHSAYVNVRDPGSS